ncbi:hypothetical protein DHEL01_v203111 [Diaporthe helianthi]|uniref:Uncharacterized protein n=1 Tax=Diaporthe helianthi TaxID=158607 RepID=A0A2P5I7P5_DIAHE|nr:hypothetical protein DHEL01_v203111 [Diaporthe helianthi]
MRGKIVSILVLIWTAFGEHVEQESANQVPRSVPTQTSWSNLGPVQMEPPVALPTSLGHESMNERHGGEFYRRPESAQTEKSSSTSSHAEGYGEDASPSPVHTHSRGYSGYGDHTSRSVSSNDGYHEQSKSPHKSRDDDHSPGHGHGHNNGHGRGRPHDGHHGNRPWHTTKGPWSVTTIPTSTTFSVSRSTLVPTSISAPLPTSTSWALNSSSTGPGADRTSAGALNSSTIPAFTLRNSFTKNSSVVLTSSSPPQPTFTSSPTPSGNLTNVTAETSFPPITSAPRSTDTLTNSSHATSTPPVSILSTLPLSIFTPNATGSAVSNYTISLNTTTFIVGPSANTASSQVSLTHQKRAEAEANLSTVSLHQYDFVYAVERDSCCLNNSCLATIPSDQLQHLRMGNGVGPWGDYHISWTTVNDNQNTTIPSGQLYIDRRDSRLSFLIPPAKPCSSICHHHSQHNLRHDGDHPCD